MRMAVRLWWALALCLGVSVVAHAEMAEFRHGVLRLGLDAGTGAWQGLSREGVTGGLLSGSGPADLDLGLDGGAWPGPTEWSVDSIDRTETGGDAVLTVVRSGGDWQVTETYRLHGDRPVIARRVRVLWQGSTPVSVTRMTLRVPGLTLGAPDAEWLVPGNFPVDRGRVADARSGRSVRERGWTGSDTGVACVTSAARGLAAVVGYTLDPSHAVVSVEQGEGEVSLAHHFECVALLRPDDSLDIGVQWLRLADLTAETLEQAAGAVLADATPGPPDDRPAWLSGAVIDELHPWGRLEAWDGGDRGNRMPSIEAQLPDLKGLGVDAIWLLPVSEKPPWVYHLPTFRSIDPQVTTPEQLRSFVQAGHRLGMRTLMDLVTYGVDPASPDIAQLPPTVWCLDPKGERVRVWGGTVLAANCDDPDWQAHIVELCTEWVREMGCDGFRLDCGGTGQTLDWALRRGRQADTAIHWGGMRQNARIRAAIRAANPEAILMPEAGAAYHFASADLLFDYPLYMACREATRMPDTAAWVGALREWLRCQNLTHSPAQQRGLVRFLELHDTVAAQDYFGPGLSHALTALGAFLPGVLLLQQEQEIGFSEDLRLWLRLRHELPELRDGSMVFAGVEADDPRVLCFARVAGDCACLVAINLSSDALETTLSWPAELGAGVPWDGLTGQVIPRGEPVALAPYQPRVLRLHGGTLAESIPVAPPVARGADPLVLERGAAPQPDGTVRETFRLAPMRHWFVQTADGMLRGSFVERHRGTRPGETHVDATPPLARCWRPVESGLWTALPGGAIAVEAEDGRGVVLRLSYADAPRLVRIEDNSARGESVEFVVVAQADARPEIAVEEVEDLRAAVAALPALRPTEVPNVTVDPLWARLRGPGWEAAFSRRHGGTLGGVRLADGTVLATAQAELYTDWGLFPNNELISLEGEPTPRLETADSEVTFRGLLRHRSWNGVQSAPVAQPALEARLTHRVAPDGGLQFEIGVTSSVDRLAARAFLACRVGLSGVEWWRTIRGLEVEEGAPGATPGQRVGVLEGPDVEDGTIVLDVGGHRLRLGSFGEGPTLPQRVFLIDSAPGQAAIYVALLDGEPFDLPAGEERVWSFRVRADG